MEAEKEVLAMRRTELRQSFEAGKIGQATFDAFSKMLDKEQKDIWQQEDKIAKQKAAKMSPEERTMANTLKYWKVYMRKVADSGIDPEKAEYKTLTEYAKDVGLKEGKGGTFNVGGQFGTLASSRMSLKGLSVMGKVDQEQLNELKKSNEYNKKLLKEAKKQKIATSVKG
jgi:hypothetical protein